MPQPKHPPQHRRRSRAVRSAAVEALEPRQYMALFLHDVDSANTGKGMWAWDLNSSMSNDGYSGNLNGWMSYLKNTMHLNYLITKSGNGNTQYPSNSSPQYNSTVVTAAHNAGLKIFPYFYIYGDAPDVSGTHSSAGEASVFNTVFGASGPGGDGAVFDIESEYGDNDTAGLQNYFSLIGKSQSGNGSGSRDKLFMAYSSFDILHFHSTQLPWSTVADYTDAAMPQMYWKAHGYSIATDLNYVDADYKNTGYLGANGIKPVIPTGQTYDSGSGLPTAAETASWIAAIKADTNAIGPNAQAGWRYKGVNYFDEHTTNASLRNEIGTELIGDLPGTPSGPSPADGAVLGGSPTLDWADVVNTFGSNSVGAATKYDVYVDGALKTTIDIVNSSTPANPSQYTPSGLATGSHTWQIVAKNMFGSTSGPVWHFAIGQVPPTIPISPNPADSAQLSSSPTLLDWDASYATSYDVTLDGVFQGNVANSQYAVAGLAQGTHTWQINAINANGTTAGPTWTFFIVPKVSNVTSTTVNGTYKAAASIAITVAFNGTVNVTGTPQLQLNSSGTASYASGSGTNTLTFNYTVGAGQNSTDLDYSSTGALVLNSGTIKDTAGNNALLTLVAPGAAGSLGANKAIVIDTAGPVVSNITSTTPNGSYPAGTTIPISIQFNENTFVTGVPQLALTGGGMASYVSGSGGTTLIFNYTISAGQNSSDLDEASAAALTLNSGTLQDAIGNSASLTVPNPGAAFSLGSNKNIVVDTAGATVSNVTSSSANGVYGAGNTVSIQVVFNEIVNVTGTPRLALNSGATVNYASGSGTATLTFTYNVAAGESSPDLDYTSTNALTLNGGTIKDLAGNTAILTLAAPGAAGSLGANKNINIAGAAPSITNVTSTTANGIYGSGAVLITISFTSNVNVTGVPKLALNSGGIASFLSGNGSSTLTFRYPVGSNQNSPDLDYTSTTALSLSGGLIRDSANNNASLILAAPGSPGSLGFNKDIIIDSLAPVATITQAVGQADPGNGSPVNFTVSFSEQVIDFDSNDIVVSGSANAATAVVTSTGPTTYNIAVSGMSSNGTVVIELGDLPCYDAAGNYLLDTTYSDNTVTFDNTPPSATYGGQTPAVDSKFMDFTVTYADSSGVNATTFDGNDVTVTGPNDYNQPASFISAAGNVVTYRIPAPLVRWAATDNGTYTVLQTGGEVIDIAGNARPAGSISTFLVNFPPPWAYMDGSTLNVQFDGTSTPITLASSGVDITATRGASMYTFSNVNAIVALGTGNDDALKVDGGVTPPLSFSNGNGHDALEVTSGTYTFVSDLNAALGNIDVVIDSGAAAVVDASQHIGTLTANGDVTLTPGGAKVLVTKGLTIAPTARLDLADNDLIVDYSTVSPMGTWTGSAYDGIAGLVQIGRNGGYWNGAGGIGTSSFGASTGLGVTEASDVLGPSGGIFSGETVDGSAVLVKFTYLGDANFDGKLNIDDYTHIDQGIGAGSNFWFNGDFNYDGKINIDDYVIIDQNILGQGSPL